MLVQNFCLSDNSFTFGCFRKFMYDCYSRGFLEDGLYYVKFKDNGVVDIKMAQKRICKLTCFVCQERCMTNPGLYRELIRMYSGKCRYIDICIFF